MLPRFISSILGIPQVLLFGGQSPDDQGPFECGGRRWLQFNRDGTFQISIFGDLHFGENAWDSWGPQQDIHSVRVMETVLDADRPDMVVLNGDLITGDNAFLENATAYVDQIVRPMVQRRLPWASTYGNHDHQYNLSGDAILARERRHAGCLTEDMVRDAAAGTSNYYVPVYGAGCRARRRGCLDHCTPELLLWFFDSRGGWQYRRTDDAGGTRVGMENWVHPSAVRWFRRTSERLQRRAGGRAIPSLAFAHIPVHAARVLQRQHKRGGGTDRRRRRPGIDDDDPLAPQAEGWCADGRDGAGCAYGGQDEPFMRALAGAPGLLAVFSAHDHGNTWCARWDGRLRRRDEQPAGPGIDLCFGQHSGYGGYGSWVRGARQVLVTGETLRRREIETWIRLETGAVVGAVCLNGTYGRDKYSITPNDETHCPTCD